MLWKVLRMQHHIKSPLALFVLGLSLATPTISHAQRGAQYNNYRAQMTGYFYNTDTKDSYNFRSNGTYTFKAGPEKSKGGNVSHSGRWSLLSYKNMGADTADGVVQLRATSRVVMEGRRKRTLKANKKFNLTIGFGEVEGVIGISGQRFVEPGAEENG